MKSPSNDSNEREKYDLYRKLQDLSYNFRDGLLNELNPEKEAEMVVEFIEVVARTRLSNGRQLSAGHLNWLIDNNLAPILKNKPNF